MGNQFFLSGFWFCLRCSRVYHRLCAYDFNFIYPAHDFCHFYLRTLILFKSSTNSQPFLFKRCSFHIYSYLLFLEFLLDAFWSFSFIPLYFKCLFRFFHCIFPLCCILANILSYNLVYSFSSRVHVIVEQSTNFFSMTSSLKEFQFYLVLSNL